ncbi:hypothetical protein NDU88_000237, partial [Pleurodeles waltl]
GSELFGIDSFNHRGQGGNLLVAPTHGSLERQGHFWFSPRGSDRIRRQSVGLGSPLQISSDRGTLVKGGAESQYQLSRTSSRLFCHKKSFPPKTDCCILLRMDNISAVRYVNKLGGTKSRILAEFAKD